MEKRRMIRRLAIGFFTFVVCLFLIVLLVLHTSALQNFLRSEISKQALERVGARVEVGSIQTHWTHLGVDLSNVVISRSSGLAPSDAPVISVQRLHVGVRFLPLLFGHFELRELILDQPVVHVQIDSRGRSNLPSASPSNTTGRAPNALFDLRVSNFTVHSGEIYYNDEQLPLDAELHDLKFQASYSLIESAYTGSLSYDHGRLETRQIRPIIHAAQLQFKADRRGISLSPLLVTTAASHVSVAARLTNYEVPSITGTYEGSISTPELAAILNEPSIPWGVVASIGSFGYDSADPRSFLAALSVQGHADSSRLDVRRTQQSVTLTTVSASYFLKSARLEVNDIVANLLGGRAKANWAMEHIDSPVPPSKLTLSAKGISLSAASDSLAPRGIQRVPIVGTSDLDLNASWTRSINNAVAHVRLSISSGSQTVSAHMIPMNGLVQADYDGPQNTIAFGQSHLETANTRLSVKGSLGSRSSADSTLTLLATSSDLNDASSLVQIIQTAVDPGSSVTVPQIGGRAALTAQITGAARAPRIQARLTGQNLTIYGSKWRSLSLNANASSNELSVQNGMLIGMEREEVSLSGKVGLTDWTPEPDSTVALQANVSGVPAATLEEIARRHDPVSGVVAVKLSVSGTKSDPNANATITLAKASAWNEPIDNLTLAGKARNGSVQSDLQLKMPAGTITGQANYTLANQSYDVKLHADGIVLQKIAALQKRGDLRGTATLTANGNGTLRDPHGELNFTIPQLQTHGQTISNISAQARVSNQHANLQLTSVVDQGSVEAKADVALMSEYQTSATLDVRALPVAAVAANFFPAQNLKLGGQTEVHATLNGPLLTPARLQSHLEIPTLNVSYGKAQIGLARPLLADYSGGSLTIAPARIQGTGTDLTFGGTVPLLGGTGYSLAADGSMDLGVLSQFAPGTKSGGQMEIHIRSDRNTQRPSMQGQFQIKNALFSSETMPVGIEGFNAKINLSGNHAEIENFAGTAGGGSVSARGSVDFGHNSNFNIALSAQSVRVRYPAGLRSMLSGQLNLQGGPSSSTLSGRVLVDSLSFTKEFDLANFAAYLSQDSSGGTPSEFENSMNLRIAVQSAQDLSLASSKLSVGGSANLNVNGTLAEPILLGRMNLTSGDVFFLGKRFQVQSGTIEFANPVRTEPVVSTYITTTVEQYNITLNLNGPVERLRTNYTSEPALPPADIIHLLAFGNTNAEAASAPSQSAAMGAESVLAQGVSSQAAGKLENLTGISQLTIDPLATNTQGDPGAQVAIQQRVTGSLLFTFSTNVTSTQSQAAELQYDLNKDVSVTVLRDQNGGYGLDLRWHRVF